MNRLEKDLKLLLDSLADRCIDETMRSVMEAMKQSMDDEEIPPAETVRSFIQHPGQPTELTAFQQALAMDNLLEQAADVFAVGVDEQDGDDEREDHEGDRPVDLGRYEGKCREAAPGDHRGEGDVVEEEEHDEPHAEA